MLVAIIDGRRRLQKAQKVAKNNFCNLGPRLQLYQVSVFKMWKSLGTNSVVNDNEKSARLKLDGNVSRGPPAAKQH
jgi:hypothetical protein